ncbi:MAG: DNA translocase FtsK [Neisseria sp.]|nr:DNA translocase FtsK [Neisseria sp.]
MIWMILSAVLAAAVAYIAWQLRKSRQDWALEEKYYRRHEQAAAAGGEAKEIYGADSNVSNSRHERKAAEQSREVYDRAVEKLKEHAPKKFRRLKNIRQQDDRVHEALPIFAELEDEEHFREVGEVQTAYVRRDAEPIREVITLEQVRSRIGSRRSADGRTEDGESGQPSASFVGRDGQGFAESRLQPQRLFGGQDSDRGTAEKECLPSERYREPAQHGKLVEKAEERQNGTERPYPEIIGMDDIRSNLLRSRYARSRQAGKEYPRPPARVLSEAEVMANLERSTSTVIRRLKRISTAGGSPIPPVRQTDGVRRRTETPNKQSASGKHLQARHFAPYPAKSAAQPSRKPSASTERSSSEDPFRDSCKETITDGMMREAAGKAVRAAETVQTAFCVSASDVWHDRLKCLEPEAETVGAVRTGRSFPAVPEREAIYGEAYSADSEETADEDETAEADDADEPAADGTDPRLPGLDLLLPAVHDTDAVQSEEALLENSILIEEKLAEYRVKVKVLDAFAGPVITRYEIEPDVGVRGSAVLNLERDLARSFGVPSIRVVETVPGKTCMGLELPNPKRQMIRLSEIFAADVFRESKSKLTLALGQDITGQPAVTDLAKAPHLLVAGTTGSGKSVGVNAMILSMLFKATPEDVRLIMIDPKMLELSIYEGIPHLLAPVVTDMKLAANALNWCVNEMERRYRLMSWMGVRNIVGYNKKIKEAAAFGEKFGNPFSLTPDNPEPLEKLPYIVVVVDEFADLMMTAGKQIEQLIARITQKARAAGIHLILATQRPSVDVITGLIKANIPTRIAFQVSSKIDSRTILDQMGAETLLGQGDMLFLPPGTGYPQRVHGAFASDEEVHEVVEFLKTTGSPDYIDDILSAPGGSEDMFGHERGEGERDPLYDEAVACVIKTQKASISAVQRYLRIGYNRAANLVEQMEEDGIVSAADGSGKRSVLARSGE